MAPITVSSLSDDTLKTVFEKDIAFPLLFRVLELKTIRALEGTAASLASAKARGINVSSWVRHLSLPIRTDAARSFKGLTATNAVLSLIMKSRCLNQLLIYGAATSATVLAASQSCSESLSYVAIGVDDTFVPDLVELNSFTSLHELFVESTSLSWPASLPALELPSLIRIAWSCGTAGANQDGDLMFLERCRFPALRIMKIWASGLTPQGCLVLSRLIQRPKLVRLSLSISSAVDCSDVLSAVITSHLSLLQPPAGVNFFECMPRTVTTLGIVHVSELGTSALFEFLQKLCLHPSSKSIQQIYITTGPGGQRFSWKDTKTDSSYAFLSFLGRVVISSNRLAEQGILLLDADLCSLGVVQQQRLGWPS